MIDEGLTTTTDIAELDLSVSVGELILGSESRSGKLIYGSITHGSVDDDLDKENGKVSYVLESKKPSFFPYTARWELGIASGIPLELAIDNSVGELRLDLVDLDLESLTANQGVGRMYIDLPDAIDEEILIKQGVGLL